MCWAEVRITVPDSYKIEQSVLPLTPALELYCQLEDQMEKRQYYEALKTLEQLEHTMLPQISGSVFGHFVTLPFVCLFGCVTLCLCVE